MDELRYPIGMQTFSKIIEEGYAYIDKTAYIRPLLQQGQFIFLSRPRRFGKSLLLSTLEAYFEGRRELFKSLAADSMDLDWTPRPVIHLDFNTGTYHHPEGLENRLQQHMANCESKFGIAPYAENDAAMRFENLIRRVYEKTGEPVVILIDEYDKPLLNLEDQPELFEKNQRLLKSFYGNLKSMDRFIRFVFITGVARFNKVSIFSDMNHLDDISLEDAYADICGWTEEELVGKFRAGIEALANEREEDFKATLRALRDYYDGYLFTIKGSRLYNPYSVLKALKKKEIDPYWFESGTPTFLVRRIRRMDMFPPDLNGQTCFRKELIAVGLNDANPIPLMFQTGYLTIGSYDRESQLYELRFPNTEVEIGFYEQLLRIYVPATCDPFSLFSFPLFRKDIYDGRPEDFMRRLATLLKDLPGEDHRESSYRAITYLLAVLSGTRAVAEHHGHRGRSDIEVKTSRFVYVFEFKYDESVKAAFDQIRDRDYAGRYAMDPRKVYLIGANFNARKEERGLEWEVRETSIV